MAAFKEGVRQKILSSTWALVGPQDADVLFVLGSSPPFKIPKFVVATRQTVHVMKGSPWSSTKARSVLFSRRLDDVEIEYRPQESAFRFDEQLLRLTFWTDRDLGAAAELALTRRS